MLYFNITKTELNELEISISSKRQNAKAKSYHSGVVDDIDAEIHSWIETSDDMGITTNRVILKLSGLEKSDAALVQDLFEKHDITVAHIENPGSGLLSTLFNAMPEFVNELILDNFSQIAATEIYNIAILAKFTQINEIWIGHIKDSKILASMVRTIGYVESISCIGFYQISRNAVEGISALSASDNHTLTIRLDEHDDKESLALYPRYISTPFNVDLSCFSLEDTQTIIKACGASAYCERVNSMSLPEELIDNPAEIQSLAQCILEARMKDKMTFNMDQEMLDAPTLAALQENLEPVAVSAAGKRLRDNSGDVEVNAQVTHDDAPLQAESKKTRNSTSILLKLLEQQRVTVDVAQDKTLTLKAVADRCTFMPAQLKFFLETNMSELNGVCKFTSREKSNVKIAAVNSNATAETVASNMISALKRN